MGNSESTAGRKAAARPLLGLPPTPPDTWTGPWQRPEQWVIWLAVSWGLLCIAGALLGRYSGSEVLAEVLAPPGGELAALLSRQLPITLLIYYLFGLAVEKGGVVAHLC